MVKKIPLLLLIPLYTCILHAQSTLTGISGAFTTDSKAPVVTVISPDGGENFNYSAPLPVNWTATDNSFGCEPISISISTEEGGSFTLLDDSLENTGVFPVDPPDITTSFAKIRVSATDNFGLSASDESDDYFALHSLLLNLKAFLEGPYSLTTHQMRTDLLNNNMLPLSQPYNPPLPYYGNPSPSWLYSGTESVTSIPAGVVDWVVIELRDAANAAAATGATTLAKKALFLHDNGLIKEPDGSVAGFNTDPSQGLFAVVWHRNHLAVMNADPIPDAGGGNYGFDFTTGPDKVYGGALGYKELESGVWGLISADGDASRQVDNVDKLSVWRADAGSSGYKGGDFSMNGQVDNSDKLELWKPNGGKGSQVPQ